MKKRLSPSILYHTGELGVVKNASSDLLMNIEPEGNASRLKIFATSVQKDLHIVVVKEDEQVLDIIRDVTPEMILEEWVPVDTLTGLRVSICNSRENSFYLGNLNPMR